MNKVMIVDDEPLTRYALRKIISQHFSGLEVVAEAENGIEAIEKAKVFTPELIFMDIKMPGLNGIEASEKILTDLPNLHIIILTAYDHFDYIQRALEIGIGGYLLKPISKETTVKKIKAIIERIQLLEKQENARKTLEKNLDSVVGIMEKDFVDQIVQKDCDTDIIKRYMDFLGHPMVYCYFMCISFEEPQENLYNSSIIRERSIKKIVDGIQKYMPFMTKFILGSPLGNCIVVLIYSVDLTVYEQQAESYMIANHVIHKLEIVEKIKVKIGIGNAYKELKKYGESFFEAYNTIKHIKSNQYVMHVKDLEVIPQEIPYQYPHKDILVLKEKIQLGSQSESYTLAHNLTKEICQSGLEITLLKEYLVQYCFDIRTLICEVSHDFYSLRSDFVGNLLNSTLIDEMNILVNVQLDLIIHKLLDETEDGNQNMTKTIYDYINFHYKQNISLDGLAEALNKSSQYTSKLFKDIFKANFVDYITGKRMDEAKNLLNTTHLRIKEISHKVGYEDSNYFCRLFKKKFGITPKEYRKHGSRVE